MKKSKWKVFREAVYYSIIAAGGPWVTLLASEQTLTNRAVMTANVMACVAVAAALKAFESSSSGQDSHI